MTASHALSVEQAPIETLRPHPRNPRNGDTDAIAQSLRVNGQYRPIVVCGDGTILAGNHTYAAAMELGWSSIQVVRLPLSPDSAEAERILLADNRTADLGAYDEGLLADLLRAVDEAVGLEGTGYDVDDLFALGEGEPKGDPDDAPPLPMTAPISQDGDLFELGPHRLLVGSATEASSWSRLLGGEVVDLLLTDPPYGVDYVGGTADRLSIAGDTKEGLPELLGAAFGHAAVHLKPGGPFYIFAPTGNEQTTFRIALAGCELGLRQQLTWVKDRFVLGRQDYHARDEAILYGAASGGPGVPIPPASPEGVEWSSEYDEATQAVLYGWRSGAAHVWRGGRRQDNVWEYDRPRQSLEHPTMKPVAMLERALRNSSVEGDLVADPFAGSGSTLMAAASTKRSARCMEVDPRYADVICRRYELATGVVPVRAGVKVSFVEEGF